jgi:hypothetical protein
VATRVKAAKQLLVALKEASTMLDMCIAVRPHPQSSFWIVFFFFSSDQILIRSTDLNEGALMWKTNFSLAEHDIATKYQLLSRSKGVLLGHLWKPCELVEQRTIPLALLGSEIYLGDFCLTIKDGTSVRTKPQAPYKFCAPERLHGANLSLASDMWSYMCLFASLYLGIGVFYGGGGSVPLSWVEQLGAMLEQ